MKKITAIHLALGALLAAVFLSTFAYSLIVRYPTYGVFPRSGDNLWRSLLHDSVLLVRNWRYQGLLDNGFALNFFPVRVWEPFRYSHYISYPPGFVLLPYLLSFLTGPDVTILFFANLSLAAHFLTAIFLLLIVNRFLENMRLPLTDRLVLSFFAGIAAILYPPAINFFQNTWWADIMVVPVYCAFVLLELYAAELAEKNWFKKMYWGLAFIGAFTDWLFCLLLGMLLLRSISSGSRHKTWKPYCIPVLTMLVFQAAIALSHGLVWKLYLKVQQRTGAQKIDFLQNLQFLFTDFVKFIGSVPTYIFQMFFLVQPILVVLFLARRKFSEPWRKILDFFFITSSPLYLHSLIVRQHYIDHTYNQVKFVVVFATAFVLLPALAVYPLRKLLGRASLAFTLILIMPLVIFCTRDFPKIYAEFYANPLNIEKKAQSICAQLNANTRFGDILFSPEAYSFENQEGYFLDIDAKRSCYNPLLSISTPEKLHELLNKYDFLLSGKKYTIKLVFLKNTSPAQDWLPHIKPGSLQELRDGIKIAEFKELIQP